MILTLEAQNKQDEKVLTLEKEIVEKKAELLAQEVPDYTFEDRAKF